MNVSAYYFYKDEEGSCEIKLDFKECLKCGAKLQPSTNFCDECGKKL